MNCTNCAAAIRRVGRFCPNCGAARSNQMDLNALLGGPGITLDNKVQRFLTETRRQGVGDWTAAPPLIRIMWLFKLDVAPPIFWPASRYAVVFGVVFGIVLASFQIFMLGREARGPLLVSTLVATVFFGLATAWSTRRLARRLRLTPWDGCAVSGA